MSRLQNTPIKIDSKKKNAILYSFILVFTEGLQESNVQTGIKNVVKIIINSEMPSIPKIILLFDRTNQSNFSINWNPLKVMSNENKISIEVLKTIKDQNNEKLRINFKFVFSVIISIGTANKGKIIKNDNIKKW